MIRKVVTSLAFFYLILVTPITTADSDIGATPGNFEVSIDGSANYSINLKTPPGSAGMTPQLELFYSSQSAPGSIGMGWSIGGISMITRGNKNNEVDGVSTGVELRQTDALYLDGQRLIPVNNSKNNTIEYRTQLNEYSRITAHTNSEAIEYFLVETKAGLKLEYGKSKDSNVKLTSKETLHWLSNRVIDSSSNYIDYEYIQSGGGSYRISRASYTGNIDNGVLPYAHMEFDYCDVTKGCADNSTEKKTQNARLSFINGRSIEHKYILKSVRSFFQDELLREYKLKHRSTNRHSQNLLVSVQEFGPNGAYFRPTKFEYKNTDVKWETRENYKVNEIIAQPYSTHNNSYMALDINGDSYLDLIHSEDSIIDYNETRFGSKDGLVTDVRFKLPVFLAKKNGESSGVQLLDVNGDGSKDLVWHDENNGVVGLGASLFTKTGWVFSDGYTPPIKISENGKYKNEILAEDINGDGNLDYLFSYLSGEAGAYIYSQVDGWIDSKIYHPPFSTEESVVKKLDVKGSKDEIYLVLTVSNDQLTKVQTFSVNDAGWVDTTLAPHTPKIPLGIPITAIHFVDLNGNDINDILISYSSKTSLVNRALLFDGVAWAQSPELSQLPEELNVDGETYSPLFSDLSGNGLNDVVVSYESSNGDLKKFVLLNETNGWRLDSALETEGSLATFEGGRNNVAIGDINADGRSDIIYVSGTGDTALNLKYSLNDINGWTSQVELAPPDPIADEDKHNLGVRFLDLDGDGLTDMLISRTDESAAKSEDKLVKRVWKNTGNGWIKHSGYSSVPYPLFSSKIGNTGVELADVNGDGLPDFLYSVKRRSGSVEAAVYLNTGNGWQKNTEYSNVIAKHHFVDERYGSVGVRIVDLNGDALADILYRARLNDKDVLSGALLNTGKTWVSDSRYLSPVDLSAIHVRDIRNSGNDAAYYFRDLNVSVVDANGDRLPELIFNHETNNNRYKNPITIGPIGFFTSRIYVDPSVKTFFGSYLNTGLGWQAKPSLKFPRRLDERERDKESNLLIFDVNGDGLNDFVYANKPNSKHKSATYLSTGDGWVETINWKIPEDAVGSLKNQLGFRTVDINADGLQDLIYSRCTKLSNPSTCELLEAGGYINNGFGWIKDSKKSAVPPLVFNVVNLGDQGVRFLDLNGDGLPDLVQNYISKSDEKKINAYINNNKRVDVLSKVVNGFDQKIIIGYTAIGNSSDISDCENLIDIIYCSSNRKPYPLVSVVPHIYVVTSVESSDNKPDQLSSGIKNEITKYRYGNYRVNSLTGSALGFEWQQIRSNITNISTTIRRVHDRTTPHLIKSSVSMLKGRILNSEENVWKSVKHGGILNDFGIEYSYYQLSLDNRTRTAFDLQGDVLNSDIQTYQYDEFGNVISSTQATSDSTSTESKNKYNNDVAKWHLGRLIESVVTIRNPFESYSSASCFSYEKYTGYLIEERANCSQNHELKNEYSRDNHGNITSVTVSSVSDATLLPRQSTTMFDKYGRFPIQNVNQVGHVESRKYDQSGGWLIESIDANGLVSLYEYDDHGTAIKQVSPTGVVKSTDIYRLEENYRGAAYAIKETISDEKGISFPPVTTWYDSKNREVRSAQTGFSGEEILEEKSYGQSGQLVGYWKPYSGVDRGESTSISYDVLGRIVDIRSSDGAEVKYKYDRYSVVSVDQLGRTTKTETNSKGDPISVVDAIGGSVEYEYDVLGRLVETIGPDGLSTRHEYDAAGNRVGTDDPNMGQWKYTYNFYGELTKQVDARGILTQMSYDSLGRMITRKSKQDSYTWSYDKKDVDGKLRNGQLVSTSNSSGHKEIFSHDEFRRLTSVSTLIDNETFITQLEHDSFNRVKLRKYPAGLEVENTYDENGYFTKVINRADSSVLWEATAIDVLGRTTRERFGNGLENEKIYDRATGFLDSEITRGSAGVVLQELTYQYDALGNTLRKYDNLKGVSESYLYDLLDRLTGIVQNFKQVEKFEYDLAGNIVNKSNYGKYSYDSGLGPAHGVSSVLTDTGTILSFSYDRNGNVVESSKGKFSYDAANLVTSIKAGKKRYSEFSYTGNGDKYKQIDRSSLKRIDTKYVGLFEKSFEVLTNPLSGSGEHIKRKNYIVGGTGVIGIVEDVDLLFPVRHSNKYKKSTTNSSTERTLISKRNIRYFTKDKSDSITIVTDKNGLVVNRFEYDVWGKRLDEDKKKDFNSFKLGFTGHEHLDHLGLIHTGGRVYDPSLARFYSADPIVQSPDITQSYNRYSYALNNPNKYIDPTGYGWNPIKDIKNGLKKIGRAIAKPFEKLGKWVEKNWKTIVVVIVVAVVTYVSASLLTGPAAGILSGMIAGAAGGATSAALHGGNILEGALIGAVVGGVTGGFAQAGAQIAGEAGRAIATGLVRGVVAAGRGGNFFRSFASAAVSTYFYARDASVGFGKVVSSSIIGGTASVIGGGKFANGAAYGAISAFVTYSIDNFKLAANAMNRAYKYITTKVGLSDLMGKIRALPVTIVGLGLGVANYSVGLLIGGQPGISFGHNAIQFTGLPIGQNGAAVAIGNTISYEKNTSPTSMGAYGEPKIILGYHEEEHTYQWQEHGVSLLWNNGGIFKNFGTIKNIYELDANINSLIRSMNLQQQQQ